GIGQPLQSAQRGQPGLEGVKRIAGLGGILLNLADDLVKECFEFPRTWRQAIGFVALRGFGGGHNSPPQPAPVPAELEGFVEAGSRPGTARDAGTFQARVFLSVRFVHKRVSFSGLFSICESSVPVTVTSRHTGG